MSNLLYRAKYTLTDEIATLVAGISAKVELTGL